MLVLVVGSSCRRVKARKHTRHSRRFQGHAFLRLAATAVEGQIGDHSVTFLKTRAAHLAIVRVPNNEILRGHGGLIAPDGVINPETLVVTVNVCGPWMRL